MRTLRGESEKVLEALDGVEQAEVSHETGTAVVEMTEEVADEVLKRQWKIRIIKCWGLTSDNLNSNIGM